MMKLISKTTKTTPNDPILIKIPKSFLLQINTKIKNKKKAV